MAIYSKNLSFLPKVTKSSWDCFLLESGGIIIVAAKALILPKEALRNSSKKRLLIRSSKNEWENSTI